MKFKFVFLFVVFSAAVLFPPIGKAETSKECIIGYELDWNGIRKTQLGIGLKLYPANAADFWSRESGGIPDFARAINSLQGHDFNDQKLPETLYFVLYKPYCDRKEELTHDLFAFWHRHGMKLPKITRISDPIYPSEDTIDAPHRDN